MGDLESWSPRTDEEYLRVLLTRGESQRLDFKEKINFDDRKTNLEFIKDVIAMANYAPGGHLLIGVCDDGSLPQGKSRIADPCKFDGASLQQKVNEYIDSSVKISTQIHKVDGREIVVIAIESPEDGLPIPMSKDGVCQRNGKDKQIFRQGDIFVRDGSGNTKIKWSHWHTILKEHDRQIREEAKREAEDLLRTFYENMNRYAPKNSLTLEDLNLDSSLDTFHQIVLGHLTSNNTKPLKRFLRTLQNTVIVAESLEAATDVLDRLTVIACESAVVGDIEILSSVFTTLHSIYDDVGDEQDLQVQLALLYRVFIIGSLLMRFELFEQLYDLIQHNEVSDQKISNYNWLRGIQTRASRAELIREDRDTLMIPTALTLIEQHSQFRPDVPGYDFNRSHIKNGDPILNSLCQFSFLQAWMITADESSWAEGYSDAFLYHRFRSEKIYICVLRNEHQRDILFPGKSIEKVLEAFRDVFSQIRQSSFGWGVDWGARFPEDIQNLLDTYFRDC